MRVTAPLSARPVKRALTFPGTEASSRWKKSLACVFGKIDCRTRPPQSTRLRPRVDVRARMEIGAGVPAIRVYVLEQSFRRRRIRVIP